MVHDRIGDVVDGLVKIYVGFSNPHHAFNNSSQTLLLGCSKICHIHVKFSKVNLQVFTPSIWCLPTIFDIGFTIFESQINLSCWCEHQVVAPMPYTRTEENV